MANPKSKVLPQIVDVYFFVLLAHCFDVFFWRFKGDASIFGTNLYGHVMGIMAIVIACVVKKKDIRAYGAVLKPKRIFKGFYRGALLSVVPIAVVAGLFSLIYAAFEVEWAKVEFIPPNIYYCKDDIAKAALVYAVTIAVSVFMKEFFFRGYVMRSARTVYQFFDANIIQAILCIPLPLVNHFNNIVSHRYSEKLQQPTLMIAIAVFYIVTEFFIAIKWGLLVRVSKDIWTVFFDHYFYNFLAYSLFVSKCKISSYESMVKLFLVQAISFAMVWFYYKKKMAEKEKHKLRNELSEIERRQKKERADGHSEKSHKYNEEAAKANESILENYTHGDVQRRIDDFSNENLHRHKHAPTVPKDYKDEDLMDLRDINVDDFYLEYIKEKERRTQSDIDSVSQKLKESESE